MSGVFFMGIGKLGKKEAKRDPRNFKLSNILNKKKLSTLPASFDCDKNLKGKIPAGLFGNDKWGDCVMCSRANMTLRFECFEQKKVIPITDNEVLMEYWAEQGGTSLTKPDDGLVVLDSLNEWRTKGWTAGNKNYDIYAFAEVDRANHEEVKTGIYHLNGVCAGFMLPVSAQGQFRWYMRWDVDACKCLGDTAVGSLGGHAVYICGYDSRGPVCITWGRKQKMTWAFFDKYCDEAFCIVDNKDKFMADSPVDVEALDKYLHAITD